jgi:creatinine amidohydrolase
MATITGGEARALYAENPVILLPMGSQEDQGPHAPMGDYLLAEKISELIALRATANGVRTVVAPVIPFGGAEHFGPMPGGIALEPATLSLVLGDIFDNLLRHKLTRIVVINGHGGNVEPIRSVTRGLHRKSGLVVPSLYLWRICYAIMPALLGAEKAARVAGHGGDPLTSIGLHLFPGVLRPDMIPEQRPLKTEESLGLPFVGLGTAQFEGVEVGLPHEYDAIYNEGVGKGDPRLCSAETGAVLTEKLTDICARFVAHFASRVPASSGRRA